FGASDESRSELPDGTTVENSERLRDYLADQRLQAVAFSTMKHLTIYSIGRSITYQEEQSLKRRVAELASDGYRLRDMIKSVVHSDAFLMK
ncbi:MAG: DUF1585 domain-containing protein, partial [Planctomycetota bacterium]